MDNTSLLNNSVRVKSWKLRWQVFYSNLTKNKEGRSLWAQLLQSIWMGMMREDKEGKYKGGNEKGRISMGWEGKFKNGMRKEWQERKDKDGMREGKDKDGMREGKG